MNEDSILASMDYRPIEPAAPNPLWGVLAAVATVLATIAVYVAEVSV